MNSSVLKNDPNKGKNKPPKNNDDDNDEDDNFDEKIKNSNKYHYLDFNNMFEKTEIMIFTKELPPYYFENIKSLNPNVTIIMDSKFKTTIEILK